MSRRWFARIAGAGFVLSAALHLATFTPAAPWLRGEYGLILFGGAFVPLLGMLGRLRGAAPVRRWRRLGAIDWRALLLAVPPPMRLLVFATAAYAMLNVTLSLLVAIEEPGDGQAGMLRMLSGQLLLLYLIPLVYFTFVEPARGSRSAAPDG